MNVDHQRAFVIAFNVLTVLFWGWLVVEFSSRGWTVASETLGNLYLLALGYYAAEKEFRRWRRRRMAKRHGEIFVLGWVFTALAMLGVEVLGGAEQGYHVPHQVPLVVGGVLTIYLITQFLKAESRQR